MAKTLLMIAVIALVAVEHDNVKFGPGLPAGDEFELSEAQAVPLLEVGAIKLKEVEAPEAPATPALAKTPAKK